MKQFSLDEYLKGPSRKVVTRDGRNVRIVCTDKRHTDYPILALIEEPNGRESIESYTENGRYSLFETSDVKNLFFAPEKHEGWVNVYRSLEHNETYCGRMIYDSKEEAKCDDYAIAAVKIEWEE